jgi:hypothetical protein
MLVEWRCSWATKMRWHELLDVLNSMNDYDTDREAVLEEVRSLPNFPQDYDPDRDEIVIVDTTLRR